MWSLLTHTLYGDGGDSGDDRHSDGHSDGNGDGNSDSDDEDCGGVATVMVYRWARSVSLCHTGLIPTLALSSVVKII